MLAAQTVVLDMIRPGVSWPDCHLAAEKEVLKALLALGVLRNGSLEEMVAAELGAVFMPHGLGHLIGIDTHDVGGYLEGAPLRPTRAGLKKLRTARILEENMVITVEPGCYFIDYLLDLALANPAQSRYIDPARLSEFRGFGGVRLEDDVLVGAEGAINMTLCPRSVEEVESVMAGGPWPPAEDKLPSQRRHWVKLSESCRSLEPVDVPLAK